MPKLASDIMTPAAKLITAKEDTPITEIAEILYKYKFNAVPVIEDDFRLVGMISQRDLIVGSQHVYLPTFLEMMHSTGLESQGKDIQELGKLSKVTVGQIMNKTPTTAEPDMEVSKLARVLAEEHINPMPIVKHSNLLGIVARSDIVKMLAGDQLHEKSRLEIPGGNPSLDPLLQQAVVKFEKGYIVVDKLRVRMWWVFLLAAFIIGFIVSIVWIIQINL